MNVEIHIDRLVLDGLDVPFAHRAALQAAIEGELARLVAASAPRSQPLAVPSVRAPEIRAGGTPAQLGNAIAGAVHKAVGGGGR